MTSPHDYQSNAVVRVPFKSLPWAVNSGTVRRPFTLAKLHAAYLVDRPCYRFLPPHPPDFPSIPVSIGLTIK